MVGDLLGHALPTAEPGRHQGEGVAPVDRGAGRAQRLAPGPARFQQHPVRLAGRVEEDLVAGPAGLWMTDPLRRTGRRQKRAPLTWSSKAS